MYQKIPAFLSLSQMSLAAILREKLVNIVSLFSWFDVDFLYWLKLSHCKNYTTVAYRTAIALSIAPKIGSNPLMLAHDLINLAQNLTPEISPSLPVSITILESGIIEFKLDNIHIWLQFVARTFPQRYNIIEFNRGDNDDLFALKLVRKRCYSLLNLAKQQGLLMDSKALSFDEFGIYEQKLIHEFVIITDNLSTEKLTTKLTKNLITVFWEFERYCRIFGAVEKKNLALSQSRLYLVYLTTLLLEESLFYLG